MATPRPRPLVAGNWKMNGLRASLDELKKIAAGYDVALQNKASLLICPPATMILTAAATCLGSKVQIGGQDCHAKASGSHTGDISAEMLADAGADYVIVGHSERRADHGETSEIVKTKAEAALRAGLRVIVCVGETRAEREAGKTLSIVRRQVKGSLPEGANRWNTVIAYEPVWAIGTGLTPTEADVAEVHADIRKTLKGALGADSAGRMRILYGGSVKPDNAKALMAVENVDGALIGGASLKAADFLAIANVYK